MPTISKTVRERIAKAANYCCEYCQTAQQISGAQMNIKHIIPISRGGTSEPENLCNSCAWCNSYKWAKVGGLDPETNQVVPLFNPRQQQWRDHFEWNQDSVYIVGKTAVGRATIVALKMNNSFILPARRHWAEAGWHPPKHV